MYKTIIEFKENIVPEVLETLKSDVALAFQNSLCNLKATEVDSKIIFEVKNRDNDFLGMMKGNFQLYRNNKFLENYKTWFYEDTEQEWECGNFYDSYNRVKI